MGLLLDLKGTTNTSFKIGGSATAGHVLTTDENGVGTWQTDGGAPGSYVSTFVNGDLVAGILTVNHNFGNQYCGCPTIIDNNGIVVIPDEITYTSTTAMAVDISSQGTITGTWRVVVLASGASTAYDVVPIDWVNPIAVTDTATLTIGRHHVVTVTAADKTLGLPAVSGNAGKMVSIEIAASTTKLITIDGNSSEKIDFESTQIMWRGETAILLCDGIKWTKIAGKSLALQASLYLPSDTAALTVNVSTKIACSTDNRSLCQATMLDAANSKITCVRAGRYRIFGALAAGRGNASVCDVALIIIIAGSGAVTQYSAHAANMWIGVTSEITVTLSVGQSVEIYCVYNGGSGLVVASTGMSTYFSVTEILSW
jgi:hypothetical protein